jgi:hypothetical protein
MCMYVYVCSVTKQTRTIVSHHHIKYDEITITKDIHKIKASIKTYYILCEHLTYY